MSNYTDTIALINGLLSDFVASPYAMQDGIDFSAAFIVVDTSVSSAQILDAASPSPALALNVQLKDVRVTRTVPADFGGNWEVKVKFKVRFLSKAPEIDAPLAGVRGENIGACERAAYWFGQFCANSTATYSGFALTRAAFLGESVEAVNNFAGAYDFHFQSYELTFPYAPNICPV